MSKILYIEDECLVRQSTLNSLTHNFPDIEVEAVPTVDEGMEILKTRRKEFDLVLTDNDTKSQHTGIQLAQEYTSQLPVIILSGTPLLKEAKAARAYFIQKPARNAQLVETITRAMSLQSGGPDSAPEPC